MDVTHAARVMLDQLDAPGGPDPVLGIARVDPFRFVGAPGAIARALYWEKDVVGLAGLGVAEELRISAPTSAAKIEATLTNRLASRPAAKRWIGGLRFSPNEPASEGWAPFGAAWFVLPAVYVSKKGSDVELGVNLDREGRVPASARSILEAVACERTPEPDAPGAPPPTRESSAYTNGVTRALAAIASGQVEKVVLARRLDVSARSGVRVNEALRKLFNAEPAGTAYLLSPEPGACFFGVTPERLFVRQGRELTCDAIAGTTKRGASPAEDAALQRRLLEDPKERREHALVVRGIMSALAPLAREVFASPDPEVLVLSRVQHLRTTVWAKLDQATSVLACLHPTPAVAGWPVESSMSLIHALEPFDRGFYSGPVGLVSATEDRYSVALRCARVVRDRVVAYSGAGIVSGSTPEEEWAEVQSKARSVIEALG
ncbi:MAG: isochorismate synthase [Deltaproteobacteria bacterium]|nr:isochorismate synthase [Deltaproteobacteria bacterium]